ncbi:MAG: hypothetical protein ACR2PX_15600 [Endozoicomonas sp.]|uniref:hypothetical protein n=1 Tax=Endozoicomonas sp. TaxID=1892382 RepID=UPI003D9BA621
MKKVSLTLLFFFSVVATYPARAGTCPDPTTGLPDGHYVKEVCFQASCLTFDFHYEQQTDTLTAFYHEKASKQLTPPEVNYSNLYLKNACQLRGQGLSIEIFADKKLGLHFGLTPSPTKPPIILQPPSPYQGSENDSLTTILMNNNVSESFHHSCKDTEWYKEVDLLFTRCPVDTSLSYQDETSVSPQTLRYYLIRLLILDFLGETELTPLLKTCDNQ